MRRAFRFLFPVALLLMPLAAPVHAADDDSRVNIWVAKKVLPRLNVIARNPALVEAIKAQNAAHAKLSQAEIDKLDSQWMAEAKSADRPLITKVQLSAASAFLTQVQQKDAGFFTEIFATDNRGLNVGMSQETSDYWQGDEDKFTKTFGVGPDAVFISPAKKDDSSGKFQIQVSVTVKDPVTGKPIGSLTAGINANETDF